MIYVKKITHYNVNLNDYGLTNVYGPTCLKTPDEPTLNDVILINCPRRLASTLNINNICTCHKSQTITIYEWVTYESKQCKTCKMYA